MNYRWGTRGEASVLVGGQFGSEGKGLAAAYLATQTDIVDIATTNAGAQAGHTTCYLDGRRFVCYHLPTTAVALKDEKSRPLAYINAGSIIDIEALAREIKDVGINPKMVVVHPRAAVITPENKATENDPNSSTSRLASTRKGVGAAISDKVMRRARLAVDYREKLYSIGVLVTPLDLNSIMNVHKSVVVEVPQGTDLGLNHGYAYPYATSRDCWVGPGLADAGIHPEFIGPVCMVIRTFPIRVGHLFNEEGDKLGDSGPFYNDSVELDWGRDFAGIEPERTTVTKRVRRIASWSKEQYERGLALNRPSIVFLNFVNYLANGMVLRKRVAEMVVAERKTVGHEVAKVYGLGPNVEDVTPDLEEAVAVLDGR